jgi:hypothetical protein
MLSQSEPVPPALEEGFSQVPENREKCDPGNVGITSVLRRYHVGA